MMPPNRNPEITWTVKLDEANFILGALAKLPLEQVGQLHAALLAQATGQLQSLQAMQQGNEAELMPRRGNGPALEIPVNR